MATAEEEKNKKKKPQQEQPNKTPSKAEGQPLPRAEAPKNLPKDAAFNRMPARGFWETVGDSAGEMFTLSGEGVNALLGRGLSSTLNDQVPDSAFAYNPRKDNGSYTFTPAQIDAQAAAKRGELYGTGGVKAERDQRALRAADEYAEDPSKWGQGKRLAGELVGGTAGDINPTYMITGPAALSNRLAAKGVPLLLSKPLSNIITQGALGGATDAAVQGGEIGEGIQDEFSWGRLGLNIAGGVAFQGLGEALGPLSRMLGGKLMPPELGLPETHRGIASDTPLAEYTRQKADVLEEITPEEVFRLADENKTPLLDMDDNPIPFNKKMAEDWANEHNAVVKAQREQGGRGLDGFDGQPVEPPPLAAAATPRSKKSFLDSSSLPVRDPGVTPEPTSSPKPTYEEVVSKFTDVLKTAGKASQEQKENVAALRSEQVKRLKEAQNKTGGETGLNAELAALQIKANKADFEATRGKFSPEEIDVLYDGMKNDPSLSSNPFHVFNARKALRKVLEGEIPTPSEMDLLKSVLPSKAISTIMRNRKGGDKVNEFIGNLINLPRTAMSTMDLSAPLRQGVFMIGRGEFYRALPSMFKEFGHAFKNHNEINLKERPADWKPAASQVLEDIRKRDTYELMDRAKLALTDPNSHSFKSREEDFMSNWVEKIPGVGRLAGASNAAYSAFLNKLRADVFDDLVIQSKNLGIDFDADPKALRDIARYVNSATGRGDLDIMGTQFLEKSAPLLNAVFFSPRLIKSRIDMLNPAYYAKLSPVVRKQAAKDMLKFTGIATTVLTLAALAGADVETDPRSSDFAKIKVGNTRYDVLGGFGQYITLASRIASGETKTGRGDIKPLDGKGNNKTRGDVLMTFMRNKLAPVPAYATNALQGENVIGEEFSAGKDAVKMMVPLFIQSMVEAYKEEGLTGIAKASPGAFGIGVNTYDEGLDRFGRDPTSKEETDPTVLALEELAPDGMDSLFGYVDKGDLDAFAATDEDVKAYQELSGQYIKEYLDELIQTPEWADMTNEERVKEVKGVAKDMRLYAREDLFPDYYAPEDDLPPEDPEDEALIEDVPAEDAPDVPSGNGGYKAGVKANTVSPYVLTIFPDAVITSTSRTWEDPLTQENKQSQHYHDGGFTVDIRPSSLPGWTIGEVEKEFNRQGLKVVYKKNEVGDGKVPWATGDNWHFEFEGWEE